MIIPYQNTNLTKHLFIPVFFFYKLYLGKDDVNSLIAVLATEQRKLCEDICYSTLFFNRTQLRMAIASRYFGAFYRGSNYHSNPNNQNTQSIIMHQSCKNSNKIKKYIKLNQFKLD